MASQTLATQKFRVDAAARLHILEGDQRGGGHRSGAGKGKSEFPPNWMDVNIIEAIEDVANDPASPRLPGKGGRVKLWGVRNGVLIVVIVDPATGDVVTGYPKSSGRP
jgi:Bacterial EndoU nuclease